MNKSGVLRPYLHQQPMEKAPPLGRDSQTRADEGSINRMTGGSKTPQIPGHARIHHEKIGDHRQGVHTGPANRSTVPRTPPGHPIGNRGNLDGVDS
jgi:hypothetical protein